MGAVGQDRVGNTVVCTGTCTRPISFLFLALGAIAAFFWLSAFGYRLSAIRFSVSRTTRPTTVQYILMYMYLHVLHDAGYVEVNYRG